MSAGASPGREGCARGRLFRIPQPAQHPYDAGATAGASAASTSAKAASVFIVICSTLYAKKMFRSLFRPQCDDGIYTRGAPRRDIAGEHRHRKHHGGHPGERGDVQTLDVEQ
jgi:hypothetical protein